MIKLRQRDGGKAPEPMLSPMIDMIFLLLVFFINLAGCIVLPLLCSSSSAPCI